MMQEQGCLEAVAANTLARARLMPSLVELLGEQRFWVQVCVDGGGQGGGGGEVESGSYVCCLLFCACCFAACC